MNDMLDWGDYKIVFAIAEAGSLTGAAKRLATSHPTLFRRINVIEKKIGVRLFERLRTGYRPTAAGEEIIATARQITELTHGTERRLAGRDLRPSGHVRITTTDGLLFGLISPALARLRESEPDITIEVNVSNEISDLAFREADIAIRPTSAPDPHLVGRKLGLIRQAIYAPSTMAAGAEAREAWQEVPWIGPSRSMAYPAMYGWMVAQGYDKQCRIWSDSVLGQHAAARAGAGIAVLPAYLAEADPALIRIGPMIAALDVELWMLTHPDLRHTARIRAVTDHLDRCSLIRQRLDER